MAKEGDKSMLQNLIRVLKDGRNGWVKQGRVVYSQSATGSYPRKVSAFDQE